jgi:hypothetical protein
MKGSSKMAVDIPSIDLLYGSRSFDGALIFGKGTAIAESTALKLKFFGLDV